MEGIFEFAHEDGVTAAELAFDVGENLSQVSGYL
jgi:hypothetical protein